MEYNIDKIYLSIHKCAPVNCNTLNVIKNVRSKMDYIQHVVETIVVRTENINGMIIKECFYKSTCSAALIAC